MSAALSIARRVALALATLVLLSVGVFFLAQVLPGDLPEKMLGRFASAEQVALLTEQLGLNRPIIERYLEWAVGFVTLDWGVSPLSGASVFDLLTEATLKSIRLGLLSFLIAVLLAFIGGIFAAKKAGSRWDSVINYSAVAAAGIPEMVIAIVFIAVFSVGLGWFPPSAQTRSDSILVQLHHLLLPALVIAPATAGYLLRIIRAEALVVYNSDYVRTATLKGAGPLRIDLSHGLRNILSPVMPVLGANLIYMATGMIVVERLFNYPALGNVLYNAAMSKDVVVLTTGTMIAGVILVGINLLSDLAMVLLNPKAKAVAS